MTKPPQTMDLGNTYPEGLPAYVTGKRYRATYVSETGIITADILVAVLTVLDELDVSPHDSGITPFMIIDGHS